MISSIIRKHPHLSLLLLSALLLLATNGNHSLLAHDEGYYAMQARWILETQDWLTPQWWGTPVYDRTIGIQWLIALTYKLLGISDFNARLPSIISCIISILLTYQIGKILLNKKIAFLAAIILSLMPIWIFEGRSATQNTALVCVELLGIWALLRCEELGNKQKNKKILWGILAGSTFGLGFLIKGFMIILPGVAIIPYLIFKNKQHRHLTNIGIYLGLVIGFIPAILWLILSCLKYNSLFPVTDLFSKLFTLSADNTYNPGTFYYFWNIPLNTFPWALFSIIGFLYVCLYRTFPKYYLSLLLGYPSILFLLLCIFRTRTPYYPLQILPFMAILAAVGLFNLEHIYQMRKYNLDKLISYVLNAFTILGIILLVAGSLIILDITIPGIPLTSQIKQYGILGIILGTSWATIITTWQKRKLLPDRYWLLSWLISPYLAITTLGFTGILGDRNPVLKKEINQANIIQVISAYPINFVIDVPKNNPVDTKIENYADIDISKNFLLLSFYTPKLGKILQIENLPTESYAWINPKISKTLFNKYQIIGTVKNWKLIHKH
jgi:4-amino-4-deoxy-L-arabinose transferase-like glycosyltransferase